MDQSRKLKKFESAVFAEVDAKTELIKQEAEELRNSELEKNKDVQLEKSYKEIQKKSQELKKKFKREVAKYGLDAKRKILVKRTEITKKVFDDVAKKLLSFYNSDEYNTYIINKLKKFSNENSISDVTIYVGKKDYENPQNIKEAYSLPCTVVEDKSINLGGFIVKHADKNIYFDETLDTILAEQKEYFIQNSELFL